MKVCNCFALDKVVTLKFIKFIYGTHFIAVCSVFENSDIEKNATL